MHIEITKSLLGKNGDAIIIKGVHLCPRITLEQSHKCFDSLIVDGVGW